MKHHSDPNGRGRKPAAAMQPARSPELGANGNGFDFAPSADEVARRAYFSYLNQGSPPGRDVQHWQESEEDLLAERDLARTHSFHHPNY